MDTDVALALSFGVLGVVLSAVSLLQSQRAQTADHTARRIDRAALRLEAFEGISGSEDMALIQRYKTEHSGTVGGYYAHFRRDGRPDVEVARSKLAKFWKVTIQLYEQKALTDTFFDRRGPWLRWGDRYRQLVEPLDVARYYREGFFEENQAEYDKASNRPRQHRFLQEEWERCKRPHEETADAMVWCVEIEKNLRAQA